MILPKCQYQLAKGFINYKITQKEVFYSVYYNKSIYFHLFYLAETVYKSTRACFAEIRHYKSTGEVSRMLVKGLVQYNVMSQTNSIHRWHLG